MRDKLKQLDRLPGAAPDKYFPPVQQYRTPDVVVTLACEGKTYTARGKGANWRTKGELEIRLLVLAEEWHVIVRGDVLGKTVANFSRVPLEGENFFDGSRWELPLVYATPQKGCGDWRGATCVIQAEVG